MIRRPSSWETFTQQYHLRCAQPSDQLIASHRARSMQPMLSIRPSTKRTSSRDSWLIESARRGSIGSDRFVTNIDYNAKGQRALIEYGNDVRTDYTYDP